MCLVSFGCFFNKIWTEAWKKNDFANSCLGNFLSAKYLNVDMQSYASFCLSLNYPNDYRMVLRKKLKFQNDTES